MDRLLFDKYCEMWWRVGGVFIADININFPGVALLAQHGISTGKLERKFSEQLGSGIKEPELWDLWHTELLTNPTTLSCSLSLTHNTVTCAVTHIIDKYTSAQTKLHIYTIFKTIWDQCSSLYVFSVWSIWKHLFLPSDKLISVCPCGALVCDVRWSALYAGLHQNCQWWTKSSTSPI